MNYAYDSESECLRRPLRKAQFAVKFAVPAVKY